MLSITYNYVSDCSVQCAVCNVQTGCTHAHTHVATCIANMYLITYTSTKISEKQHVATRIR